MKFLFIASASIVLALGVSNAIWYFVQEYYAWSRRHKYKLDGPYGVSGE